MVTCPSRDEGSQKVMTTGTVFSILVILISPAIGSFLGVLVDRLPRAEDVITKPSACRNCAQRLGVMQLLPIASYLMQRGKCEYCSAGIPPVTLYIELLAVGAAVLAVLAGGPPLEIAVSAVWLWLLIALGMSDAVWLRLPDPLTLSLFICAGILCVLPQGVGVLAAILGAALGVGSFAVLKWGYFRLRGRVGLGLGDVKLMGGLGAFCGPAEIPMLVLIAAISTLVFAFLTRERAQGLAATRPLPFGTALCFAAAVIWLFRVSP